MGPLEQRSETKRLRLEAAMTSGFVPAMDRGHAQPEELYKMFDAQIRQCVMWAGIGFWLRPQLQKGFQQLVLELVS